MQNCEDCGKKLGPDVGTICCNTLLCAGCLPDHACEDEE